MSDFLNMQAKWSSKTTVDIRCGGHGKEHVGKTVYAMSKKGTRKAVKLVKLIEDYGHGDVCEYEVEFV